MLAGEFVAYVAFPRDIVTQLNVSLERLVTQLWPSGLLAFFLAANPPQLVNIRTHGAAKESQACREISEAEASARSVETRVFDDAFKLRGDKVR